MTALPPSMPDSPRRLGVELPGIGSSAIARLTLLGVASAGCAVTASLVARAGIDAAFTATATADEQALCFSLLAAATCGHAALVGFERFVGERLGQRYVHELRCRLFDHLSRVSPGVLAGHRRGSLAISFLGDLSAIRRWTSLGLARALVSTACLGSSVLGLALVHWSLASGVMVMLAMSFAVARLQGDELQRRAVAARRARGRLAAFVVERIGAMATVQVRGTAGRERRRHARRSMRLANTMVDRAGTVARMRGLAQATSGLAMLACIITGALLASSGAMTIGSIAGALLLLGMLGTSVQELGRVGEYRREARVARARLQGILALPASLSNAPQVVRGRPGKGTLSFRDVGFGNALTGFEAEAPAGAVVAITGPNGAGKTTLLRIAARLVELDRGSVLLDGIDMRHLSLGRLHRSIAFVAPDMPLMSGTVEANLDPERSARDSTMARLRRLLKLDRLTESLPNGRATRLLEGGSNLSLGQRQRLQLARAMAERPAVLLLDEPTANLDPSARRDVLRAIAHHRGTVLFTSHDQELIMLANRVWRLEQGHLVASQILPDPPRSPSGRRALLHIPRSRVFALGGALDDPEALAYVPESAGPDSEVLVLVHGISRAPLRMLRRFAEHAERHRIVLLAPWFTRKRDRGYQRLAVGESGVPADEKLLRRVDQLRGLCSMKSHGLLLFGFSGGAQFVQRFWLRHSRSVTAAVAAAAGWYSMPDLAHSFPEGIASSGPEHTPLDLDAFLSKPLLVAVGSADTDRDQALNKSPTIDDLQGPNRFARAHRFVSACRSLAIQRGVAENVQLAELPGCNHDFHTCDERGDLTNIAIGFLVAQAARRPR